MCWNNLSLEKAIDAFYLENAKWKIITLTFKLCHSTSHWVTQFWVNSITLKAMLEKKNTSASSSHRNTKTLYYHLYCLCHCFILYLAKKLIRSLGNIELLANFYKQFKMILLNLTEVEFMPWCSWWSDVNREQARRPHTYQTYTMKMSKCLYPFFENVAVLCKLD